MATVHGKKSTAKTTEYTVNAGATQQPPGPRMQGNTDDRKEEPMDSTYGGQQSDATATGSVSAPQDQAKVPTSQAGATSEGPRQLPHSHFSEHTQEGHHDVHHGCGHTQNQMNEQLQRPLQASKQMAYQVFANVITAIEELEHRESKKKRGAVAPERSKAFIPDQTFKNDQDVVAGVEAQLTVFQAHMGFCPKEISEQVKVEMIDTTLTWAAARQDLKLPQGKVDQYAVNLLEILYVGATQQTFSILKKSWRLLNGSELMSGFRKIMQGQAKGMQLDKQFMEDPAKEAEALPIRQGKHISDGILRLMETAKKQKKSQLVKYLELHLESISCAR